MTELNGSETVKLDGVSDSTRIGSSPRRFTRMQASDFLTELGFKVAEATLAKYATVGGGPKFMKFGRRVLYSEDALLVWANGKLSGPAGSTSELA